jgi:hypothetical protein
VIVLLIIMAGLAYAFVESFGEKDVALLVVLAAAFFGCGAIVCVIVRGLLVGWDFRNVWIRF